MYETPPFDAGRFLGEFFGALFGPADRLHVAQLLPDAAGGKGTWHNASLLRDNALSWICDKRAQSIPNLYFAAGVHNGGERYTQADSTSLPALFVDLDAGPEKPFRDINDTLAFVLTHPMQATAAWVTGHGVQMMFLLDKPLPFVADTPDAERTMQVWRRLTEAFVADACRGPEHPFRVPLTLNVKPDKEPVEGRLLWWKPERRWTLDELDTAVQPWLEPAKEEKAQSSPPPPPPPASADTVPYAQLPAALRSDIEGTHDDRSRALFIIVAKLVAAGHGRETIQAAMAQGPEFRKKYGRRLADEVDRCLGKITQSPYRVGSSQFTPLLVRRNVSTVPLGDCAPLPDAVAKGIEEYGRTQGVSIHPWVRDAARFHEHVVAKNKQGVLLAPCGAGKSTWAMAHIAAHATPKTRYLYVVETVRQLYAAADKLEKLTDVPVGRVHAFNAEKCQELCGQDHDWKQCAPRNPKSVCHTCPENSQCAFYGRAEEEAKPIVAMTHAGFVRLVEGGDVALKGAHVIVDEDLNVFANAEVTTSELELVQRYVRNQLNWGVLFPYSRAIDAMRRTDIGPKGRSFAARNYVYRKFEDAPELEELRSPLRTTLATGLQAANAFTERPGMRDTAREVISKHVNLLRASENGDCAYSYTEQRDDRGNWAYRVRKQRFSLGTDQPWASMWILNASAMLTPVEYPPNMPVFTCPDLPDGSHLLRLNVVVASPTASKQETRLCLSHALLRFGAQRGRHTRVLVATAKNETGLDVVESTVRQLWPQDAPPEFKSMTRGRIKGSNDAGECTLAILSSMPLFTTVDDYVLQASLILGRSLPRSVVHNPENDELVMNGGRFSLPAIQDCYALSALDELYQTVWRAAVRNGHATEVVLTLPDVSWMIALWQTVMPRAQVISAYKHATAAKVSKWGAEREGDLALVGPLDNLPPEAIEAVAAQRRNIEDARGQEGYEQDDQFVGIQNVINMPAGQTITKSELAALLGYGGSDPWANNRERIRGMVAPWMMENPHNKQQMVRLP